LLAIESTALLKMPMPPCLIPTPNVHCPIKPNERLACKQHDYTHY
jgi:hypothetical protein